MSYMYFILLLDVNLAGSNQLFVQVIRNKNIAACKYGNCKAINQTNYYNCHYNPGVTQVKELRNIYFLKEMKRTTKLPYFRLMPAEKMINFFM